MAGNTQQTLQTIADIVNPEITTVIEFDKKTTTYLAGSIAVAGVIIVVVWGVVRYLTRKKTA